MQTVAASDMQELGQVVAEGKLRPALGLQLAGISTIPDALAGHSNTLGQGHRKGKTVISLSTHLDREQFVAPPPSDLISTHPAGSVQEG